MKNISKLKLELTQKRVLFNSFRIKNGTISLSENQNPVAPEELTNGKTLEKEEQIDIGDAASMEDNVKTYREKIKGGYFGKRTRF